MKHAVIAALALSYAVSPAGAEEPFRLATALDTPDWLRVKGEARVRYESLGGQFRANRTGSDQLLLMRTLLGVEADTGPVTFGVELQDSRSYLGDTGTPLSTSLVNPLDFLQAYVRFDALPGLLGDGSTTEVTLGRKTMSVGSQRQIERVEFANVIFSYTGAHLINRSPRGDELHVFHVSPTGRFPSTRPGLDDNDLSGDEEAWGRRIWAVHYRRADIVPGLVEDLWGEVFLYGLEERDTSAVATPDRSHLAPGFRLWRKPQAGRWDIDLEGALRRGTRYASSARTDTQSLDVEASMLFAALGYSFETAWSPRVSLEYYYASGDEDPNDRVFGQHERLFGSRRTDLNNTSIHGPLTPANLSAPGVRVQVTPGARWDGWAQYHAVSLASATDSWVIAGLRDRTGQSGDFVGHSLDTRARYWIVPDSVRLEFGGSALVFGEFARNVPGGPEGDGTLFGYAQLSLTF